MRRHRAVQIGLTAMIFSALLLVGIYAGSTTHFGESTEVVSRLAFRAAYLVASPAWTVSYAIWPPNHHHYSNANLWFACVTTGIALAVALNVGHAWWTGRFRTAQIDGSAERGEKLAEAAIPRRDFLTRSAAGGFALVSGSVGGYSTYIEPLQLRVQNYTMPVRDLPSRFDGLRLLQFSDSHYGPFISLKYIRSAIAQANALEPDVLLLTGDYVHKYPETIDRGIGVLEELRSKRGVVAVMGNHEHWEGAAACRARFAQTPIPLIENTRLFLTPDGLTDHLIPGESICLAGLGDLWEDRVSFADALGGVPDDMPRIVLAHNPDTSMTTGATQHRVDFMCSGHTHGGQVSFPGVGPLRLGSAYGRRFAGGICKGQGFPVVVSRAVGMAMLPVRFRVPPELVLITLNRQT